MGLVVPAAMIPTSQNVSEFELWACYFWVIFDDIKMPTYNAFLLWYLLLQNINTARKGEVNELRQLLRTFGTERDKQRKREIMKKVIAYMTLGIDVSRLFTEMMLAIESEL